MRYNPHTHHRRTIRLPAFDYAQPGAYFVTICTFGRECIFDSPPFRGLAEKAWSAIVGGSVDPDDGYFVVMPIHVHGVVLFDGKASGARHHNGSPDRDPNSFEKSSSESNHMPHASPLRMAAVPFLAPRLDGEMSGGRHHNGSPEREPNPLEKSSSESNHMRHASPLRKADVPGVGPSPNSLGAIVGSFKIADGEMHKSRAKNTCRAGVAAELLRAHYPRRSGAAPRPRVHP
jgi:hypothetical protein